MKYLLLLLCCFSLIPAFAQQHFIPRTIPLPPELARPKNEFSGLFIHAGKLLLLSESRLQNKEKPEAKLYAINLTDLDRQLQDSTYVLPYRKYRLRNLEVLKDKIGAAGQAYEGLEAMVIDGPNAYFSVETATASASCFLLKGTLQDTAVVMDTNFLVTLPKPTAPDGTHIYNAGFEALAKSKNSLTAFFEYNYFPTANYAYQLPTAGLTSASKSKPLAIAKLPFRITDITSTKKNHFTAINFFFRGDDDSVYRTPAADPATRLIKVDNQYRSYCRLIDIKLTGRKVKWQPLFELPAQLMGYNWEGIAAYKQGYFLVNDTYTPKKPSVSTLLYLQQR